MSDERARKIAEAVYATLRHQSVPDNITGSIKVNLQSGGVSGKSHIVVEHSVDVTRKA